MGEEFSRIARYRAFAIMEKQNDLFSHRVDGWCAWRAMRNPVFRSLDNIPLSQPARSTAARVVEAVLATLKLFWLLFRGEPRDILVKTCRSALRMKQGEQFRDVYFDGVLDKYSSYFKLEEINSPDFATQAAKAWKPSDLDPVVFTFWGRVLGTMFPVKASDYCADVASTLERELSLKINQKFLLLRLSTLYWQIRLYQVLLARIRPKVVLVSDTGEYALCVASHRQNIPFIELQHGVFDSNHPDAIPAWVRGAAKDIILPTFLASRGRYWIEQLAATRQGRDHAVAVGNELIDIARMRRSERTTRHAHLVLTTQGLDSARLAAWVGQMIAEAPQTIEWRLSIKLHPVYDQESEEFATLLEHARVCVVRGSEQPNVFDLLADADLHLSIASACHFDAAALGVRTIIIPLEGHEPLLSTVDGNQFFVARAPKEVWNILRSTANIRIKQTYRFSEPDFVSGMQKLLGDVTRPEGVRPIEARPESS